ncbi:TolC family outer membrane protein [Methyloradius palustris]|uniref:TolC family outer membrane protein n=1 Tax=Methyloradius palustris TaxID=2778876 RepID=UPI001CED72E2|nr:TolC family outer membrane protein [Methyloradius palustris]
MRLALATAMLLTFAISARAEDLLEVYHLAQANDPTFDAARYALQAAYEKVPQARAGLLPVVNINGNDNANHATTEYSAATNSTQVKRSVQSWAWNLQLTQPLFRLQNILAYKQSEYLVAQGQAQYSQAEQDIILRLTQAYFDVLVAKETIEVAESQMSAATEQMGQAQAGFDHGTNAITDVHEAKARIDLARAQKLAAINDLEAKRAELEKIVGQAPEILASLNEAEIIPKPQPEDVNIWIEQARINNPNVVAPQAIVQAAESEINRNRAEYLPTVDIVASYGQNYTSNNLTLPSDYSTQATTGVAGVQVTVPLYAGGSTNSKVTEAIANKSKAQAQLEIAKRQAATDARQAYSGIINGLAQIEALESAVDSSESAVEGNKQGYKFGIHINIDILNAERQLYTAKRDLIKARYDTLIQGLKLKASVGTLTEADVAGINQLLVK